MTSPTPLDLIKIQALVAGFNTTASLVASDQGETVGENGNSLGLGNSTDLALLKALRRKSRLVLTSGATFRADQYRFPLNTDLAVLSRSGVTIEVPKGQRFHLLQDGYLSALQLMNKQYQTIHVEFGERGISELISARALDALLLSSIEPSGVELLAKRLGVTYFGFELENLFIGLVAWQQ